MKGKKRPIMGRRARLSGHSNSRTENKKRQRLLTASSLETRRRRLLNEGYRLLYKENRTARENRRLQDIQAELNSIRTLKGKQLL